MTLHVLFATDAPRHPEAAAIAEWLAATPGLAYETVPLRRAATRSAEGAVVWIHGTRPLALEALGSAGPRLLVGGRALLTGGAAVLPSAAGVDPSAPNDVVHGKWPEPPTAAGLVLRGHASFRGHPLFEGLGDGADTWAPQPGESYTRVSYLRPAWPGRARVLAVERMGAEMDANRATIWEYAGESGHILCIGGYLALGGRGATWRSHAVRLALNSLRWVGGGGDRAGVERAWRPPDVTAVEDRSLGIPELPLLEESLGSVDFRLRAAGRAVAGTPFTLAGRRAFAVGDERLGVSEVWAHPLRLAVRPRVLGAVGEVATVTPVGLERRLALDDRLLLERVVVPRDGAGCFLEWEARGRALSFDVEWHTDLRPARPYPPWATGPLRWRRAGRGVVVAGGDDDGDDRALFVFSVRPDRMEVEGLDRDGARIRIRARLTVDARRTVRLLMLGAVGAAALPRLLRSADRAHGIAASRAGHADRLLAEGLAVRTPDPVVDQALEWATLRLASYAAESTAAGPVRIAGYGPAGDTGAHAGCAVVDAAWSGEALLALGSFDAVRETITALGEQQSPSGQIPSECSTAGPVRFGSPHATALFLRLVGRHAAWSGDLRFLQAEWTRTLAAYEFLRQAEPPASLADAAVRAAALAGLVHAAEAIGDRGSAVEFSRQASAARAVARSHATRVGAAAMTPGRMLALLLDVVPGEWVEPAGDAPAGGLIWAGWLAWAGFVAGRPGPAFQRWRDITAAAFDGARGAWGRVDADGCPDHSAATAMAVNPLVYGLLGAEPDATRGRLVLRPRPPAGWDRLEVRSLRMGEAAVSLRYRRAGDTHRFALIQDRGVAPVQLILEPELEGRLAQASVDGVPAELGTAPAGDRTRVSVQLALDAERTLELTTVPGSALVEHQSG